MAPSYGSSWAVHFSHAGRSADYCQRSSIFSSPNTLSLRSRSSSTSAQRLALSRRAIKKFRHQDSLIRALLMRSTLLRRSATVGRRPLILLRDSCRRLRHDLRNVDAGQNYQQVARAPAPLAAIEIRRAVPLRVANGDSVLHIECNFTGRSTSRLLSSRISRQKKLSRFFASSRIAWWGGENLFSRPTRF